MNYRVITDGQIRDYPGMVEIVRRAQMRCQHYTGQTVAARIAELNTHIDSLFWASPERGQLRAALKTERHILECVRVLLGS